MAASIGSRQLNANLQSSFTEKQEHANMSDVYLPSEPDMEGLLYNCFRIPVLLRIGDNRLLSFAEGRRSPTPGVTSCPDHGDVRIVMRISENDGLSWGRASQVAHVLGQTVGNPAPVYDRERNAVHLFFCVNNRQLFLVVSLDGGKTWDVPQDKSHDLIPQPVSGFVGTGPSAGVQLPSGRLVVAAYWTFARARIPHNGVYCIISADHGATWFRSVALVGHKLPMVPVPPFMQSNVAESLFEPAVARQADGRLAMLMRLKFSNKKAIQHALAMSADGGTTWSVPQLTEGIAGPSCEGSLLGTSSGLFASAPAGGGAASMSRKTMTVSLLGAEERVWSRHATLWMGPSSYSSMVESITRGEYLLLFERGTATPWDTLSLARFQGPMPLPLPIPRPTSQPTPRPTPEPPGGFPLVVVFFIGIATAMLGMWGARRFWRWLKSRRLDAVRVLTRSLSKDISESDTDSDEVLSIRGNPRGRWRQIIEQIDDPRSEEEEPMISSGPPGVLSHEGL
eukprot:TRINITY_DN5523_c0_g1_i1.p1 TRINITY_DN5523_c0_g1~~TRINITY_DN5523_c0_g1_i1.p1  ORF type:complete len:574 (+),score=57.29 TRINITY_DN5523_c0_g1_i1:197-1723(+)